MSARTGTRRGSAPRHIGIAADDHAERGRPFHELLDAGILGGVGIGGLGNESVQSGALDDGNLITGELVAGEQLTDFHLDELEQLLIVILLLGIEWSIQTEQELFAPKLADGLPELCFSTLPGTGELICIKRGESGYYPSDWNTNDPVHNREIADYNNERLGVTQEQRLAMECGSMHGWGVPGADPACYEQKQEMGGMTLG